jgi:hypothetical protein
MALRCYISDAITHRCASLRQEEDHQAHRRNDFADETIKERVEQDAGSWP